MDWFDLKKWSPEEKNKALVLLTMAAWVVQVVYTLSPIDLIPDFIPFIGLLDDLVGLAGVVSMTGYVIHMLRNGGAKTLLGDTPPKPSLARVEREPVAYEPLDPIELKNL